MTTRNCKRSCSNRAPARKKPQRGYRPEEIAEARAAAAQAKADYEQRKNGYRQEDIAAAQADLDRAKADEIRTHAGFRSLRRAGAKRIWSPNNSAIPPKPTWKIALAQQQNAQHKLDELHRGYRPEEIASAKARYQQTQATLEKLERGNRREDVDLAKAAYSYDEARFRERQVVAPSAATVEVLDVRPGDLIAPNTPVATLLERDQIYVRIYIPETEIGHVQLGQKAEVRVDSFPKTRLRRRSRTDQSASGIPAAQRADPRGTRPPGFWRKDSHQRSLPATSSPGMAADVKLKDEVQAAAERMADSAHNPRRSTPFPRENLVRRFGNLPP